VLSRASIYSHWLLLAIAVVDWYLLRTRHLIHSPALLAALVGVAVAAMVVRGVVVLVATARGRWGSAGEALLLVGLLIALGAGMANWLYASQGFVILHEGEAVPLMNGSHLAEFSSGPLARLEELKLTLFLREVELVSDADGAFHPRSRLRIDRPDGDPVEVMIDSATLATAGPLRLHQGAFGFAPRIVLIRDDVTLFDRVVPFTTRRGDGSGVSFEGQFTVEDAGLAVEGRIELASLDDRMRGHATLAVAVHHDDSSVGRGRLLPGHFAEMSEGYRVGFAGLKKWSEIIVNRRDYSDAIRIGGGLAAIGLVLWSILAWKNR